MIIASDWTVLRALVQKEHTLTSLAQAIKRSRAFTSKIVQRLTQDDFVFKERRGLSVHIKISSTAHAQGVHRVIIEQSYVPFEKFMSGKRILILFALLKESKSVKELAFTCGLDVQMIRHYLRKLLHHALLGKEGMRYRFAKRGLPDLWDFLNSYRMYSKLGKVVWKLGDEVLFETRYERDAQLTGFNVFPNHGVKMYSVKGTYYLPKKHLSIDEVAIHALAQLNDSRLLALTIVFFLKHKLTYKRVELLAAKYDCRERLRDLFTVIRSSDRRIVTDHLPPITRAELGETLKMYEVNYVHT